MEDSKVRSRIMKQEESVLSHSCLFFNWNHLRSTQDSKSSKTQKWHKRNTCREYHCVCFVTVYCAGGKLILRARMTLTRKTCKGRRSSTFCNKRQFSTLYFIFRSFLAMYIKCVVMWMILSILSSWFCRSRLVQLSAVWWFILESFRSNLNV